MCKLLSYTLSINEYTNKNVKLIMHLWLLKLKSLTCITMKCQKCIISLTFLMACKFMDKVKLNKLH